MSRIDIMVDLETLGTDADSPWIQISAIAFNLKNMEEIDIFENKIAIDGILNVSASTLKWWLKTDSELFVSLISGGQFSEHDAVVNFHSWVTNLSEKFGHKNVYLWGNGIMFDNKMIQAKMSKHDLAYPIFYRNDRDVRTFVESACIVNGLTYEEMREIAHRDFKEHDALQDCRAQIKLLYDTYMAIAYTGK